MPIDENYIREACGGDVETWEVAMLIEMQQQPQLSVEEHGRLMELAQRARDDGQSGRAHTLAEQAWAGRREIATLLYLLDIRILDLEEVAFGVACYHTALHSLPLSDAERSEIEQLHSEAELTLRTSLGKESAPVLTQHRSGADDGYGGREEAESRRRQQQQLLSPRASHSVTLCP